MSGIHQLALFSFESVEPLNRDEESPSTVTSGPNVEDSNEKLVAEQKSRVIAAMERLALENPEFHLQDEKLKLQMLLNISDLGDIDMRIIEFVVSTFKPQFEMFPGMEA